MTSGFPVVFLPSGKRGEFAEGTPLLQAARFLGVDIDSVCGGRGLCGRCQIVCAEGDFPKHGLISKGEHLSRWSETERRFEARKGALTPGRRLSCHTLIQGPLVIDVPAESQVHRQVIRKSAIARDIQVVPDIQLHYVQVPENDLDQSASDLSRIQKAMVKNWSLPNLRFDPSILSGLHNALRDGEGGITLAIYSSGTQKTIIAVWPGLLERVFGAAVDIGSTTIALHLTDLKSGEVLVSNGLMNPQIRFGEDLMSRVSYVLMHPEGADEMTAIVRAAINDLIVEAAKEAGIEVSQIVSLAAAGNPIMHHLLLGIDPSPLGTAPFTLAVESAVNMPAARAGIVINPGGRLYMPPCIAGHVGADTAAVIISEAPQADAKLSLIIDIGTNAEIVLGNRDKLLACSSPTGPAFEGAQISCGQRAAAGAIERVRIDPETLVPRYRVIGCEYWSDDPQFGDATKHLSITGICGSGIIEVIGEMYLAGILSTDGVIQAPATSASARVVPHGRTFAYVLVEGESPVMVTQNDIRQIQLAKAALYAGVKLLMDRFPTNHVDEIRIAGAFGSNVDSQYAMLLGLIPDCDLEHVHSVGNAASTGIRIALLNHDSRAEITALVPKIEKIETATEPLFQEYFVDAMAIPHKRDPFSSLFSKIERPKPIAPVPHQSRRRRRVP
ncbi:MAG: ASKHA domain-containing protein [Proteobacteria bacterium]|nr:ASKHA domain-containing protein [Pseudomonadota bacterium]